MSCDYDDIHVDFSAKLDRVVLFMEAQLPWECVQAFGGKLDSVYKKSNCDSYMYGLFGGNWLQCMDDAGCALPMPWEMSAPLCKPVPNHDSDHEHSEDCGHDQIAHGDHFDWLVPLRDGSFILSHAQQTENGGPRFIEHGRLVNLGETLGKLKWRPKQLVHLFSYETPKRNGYECLPHTDSAPKVKELERTNAFNSSPDSHRLTCTSECQVGLGRSFFLNSQYHLNEGVWAKSIIHEQEFEYI